MNSATETQASSRVQTLYSVLIGPQPLVRSLIWAEVSDFQRWPEIIGTLADVSMKDGSPTGRGSQIELGWQGGRQRVTFTHWHREQCLEFVSKGNTLSRGYRFTLINGADQEHIRLVMEFELELTGLLALLGPLLRPLLSRRAQAQFRPLIEHLRNLP